MTFIVRTCRTPAVNPKLGQGCFFFQPIKAVCGLPSHKLDRSLAYLLRNYRITVGKKLRTSEREGRENELPTYYVRRRGGHPRKVSFGTGICTCDQSQDMCVPKQEEEDGEVFDGCYFFLKCHTLYPSTQATYN